MRMNIDSSILNGILVNEVLNHRLLPYELNVLFELLYTSGCRCMDAIEISRWQLLANGNVLLTPQKNNNIRVFLQSEVPIIFYDALVNSDNLFVYLSYKKAEYYLSELLNKYDFRINKKRVTTHIFRHNYVKLLVADGMQNEDIKIKLGEKHLSSAMQYINSVISYCN